MNRLVLLVLAATSLHGQTGTFQLLGKYRGQGALVAQVVAKEKLYLSYLYAENTIEVVAVDPATGDFKVYPNPAAGEYGARCMAVGPDGNVYLGTLPHAHFLKLDVKAGELIDVGRPSPTEQYIWDVNFGADGKLYGATYPESRLVRYDPKSNKLEDLGRMDPVEQYAHFVAGSDDGFVYVGIGTSRQNIAAYEIATGEHREILPDEFETVGQANVYRATDGRVYGSAAGKHFRLQGWSAEPIDEAPAAEPHNRLQDGRSVAVEEHTLQLKDAKTGATTERKFGYEGNALPLFRIGFAPDGDLYGSSVLPIHLVRLDQAKRQLTELGGLGGGEVYSFLARGRQFLMAAYSGYAPLMIFDPARPFSKAGERNPAPVNFKDSDSGWRPQAMINGPRSLVYIGAVAGYGKLGGPLTVWNVETGAVEQYHNLIRDQSVVTLAVWHDKLAGGTTIGGGGGSHPTQKEAKIFLWEPATRQKEFETVPVAGATSITDLITARNGLVYGIAGDKLFVFDPEKRTIVATKPLPFQGAIYNSVASGPDGRIWGLTGAGIFVIDPATDAVSLVAKSPEKITAGFELRGDSIYFVSGPSVYRYMMRIAPHDQTRMDPAPRR